MLDWSYRLLGEAERKLLRWLGVFAEPFAFEAACYLGQHCDLSETQVLDALCGLVSKSLAIRIGGDAVPRYRLLSVTRAYALLQLEHFGERDAAERACAQYLGPAPLMTSV
jgi:predicted ATPase